MEGEANMPEMEKPGVRIRFTLSLQTMASWLLTTISLIASAMKLLSVASEERASATAQTCELFKQHQQRLTVTVECLL